MGYLWIPFPFLSPSLSSSSIKDNHPSGCLLIHFKSFTENTQKTSLPSCSPAQAGELTAEGTCPIPVKKSKPQTASIWSYIQAFCRRAFERWGKKYYFKESRFKTVSVFTLGFWKLWDLFTKSHGTVTYYVVFKFHGFSFLFLFYLIWKLQPYCEVCNVLKIINIMK